MMLRRPRMYELWNIEYGYNPSNSSIASKAHIIYMDDGIPKNILS
jgi:hypothetical protein